MTKKSSINPKFAELTKLQRRVFYIYGWAGLVVFIWALYGKEYSTFSGLFFLTLLLSNGFWFYPKIKKHHFVYSLSEISVILLVSYFLSPILFYFLRENNISEFFVLGPMFALAFYSLHSFQKKAE